MATHQAMRQKADLPVEQASGFKSADLRAWKAEWSFDFATWVEFRGPARMICCLISRLVISYSFHSFEMPPRSDSR
jgi:hypothetical protein